MAPQDEATQEPIDTSELADDSLDNVAGGAQPVLHTSKSTAR
jgi:hypothetical protein